MPGTFALLAERLAANQPTALATAISGTVVGAKLLVPGEGTPSGGIHPALDAQVATDARALLAAGRNETRSYALAGETVEIFIESFPPPERLVIVGAVHIAIPLHRLGKMLGYHVTVIDPRPPLATPERFPAADAIRVEWPDDAIQALGLDGSSSVVVLSHDPKFDQPALLAALQSPARYIGAIGSRTTNEQRMTELRDQGMTDAQLARIYAPIGLNLGAQTPTEIALAIMAEILAARQQRPGGHMREAASEAARRPE